MFSVQTLIVAALLAELVLVGESSFGEGTSTYEFDLSDASDLNRLYNSPVYRAVWMKRPLGSGINFGPFSHSGVQVTLGDGSSWLVHKGNRFGISSQTVVVDARHMSDSWQEQWEDKNFEGRKTVADFVRAGGPGYRLLFDNCHSGARRMMDQ